MHNDKCNWRGAHSWSPVNHVTRYQESCTSLKWVTLLRNPLSLPSPSPTSLRRWYLRENCWTLRRRSLYRVVIHFMSRSVSCLDIGMFRCWKWLINHFFWFVHTTYTLLSRYSRIKFDRLDLNFTPGFSIKMANKGVWLHYFNYCSVS